MFHGMRKRKSGDAHTTGKSITKPTTMKLRKPSHSLNNISSAVNNGRKAKMTTTKKKRPHQCSSAMQTEYQSKTEIYRHILRKYLREVIDR